MKLAGQEEGVHPVQDAAVPRKQARGVLHPRTPLEDRLGQIADDPHETQACPQEGRQGAELGEEQIAARDGGGSRAQDTGNGTWSLVAGSFDAIGFGRRAPEYLEFQ